MRRWVPLAIGVVAIVVALQVLPVGAWITDTATAVRDAGPAGRVAFAALYALATVLLARGPRVLPSADVSMFFMLETVLTPVWIWLLFGEVPGERVLLGGAVVVATLFAHSWWRLFHSLRHSPAPA